MLLSSEFVCIGQLNLTALVASTNYYNCLDIQQRAASGFFKVGSFFVAYGSMPWMLRQDSSTSGNQTCGVGLMLLAK